MHAVLRDQEGFRIRFAVLLLQRSAVLQRMPGRVGATGCGVRLGCVAGVTACAGVASGAAGLRFSSCSSRSRASVRERRKMICASRTPSAAPMTKPLTLCWKETPTMPSRIARPQVAPCDEGRFSVCMRAPVVRASYQALPLSRAFDLRSRSRSSLSASFSSRVVIRHRFRLERRRGVAADSECTPIGSSRAE